jgi:hypothetical protein
MLSFKDKKRYMSGIAEGHKTGNAGEKCNRISSKKKAKHVVRRFPAVVRLILLTGQRLKLKLGHCNGESSDSNNGRRMCC